MQDGIPRQRNAFTGQVMEAHLQEGIGRCLAQALRDMDLALRIHADQMRIEGGMVQSRHAEAVRRNGFLAFRRRQDMRGRYQFRSRQPGQSAPFTVGLQQIAAELGLEYPFLQQTVRVGTLFRRGQDQILPIGTRQAHGNPGCAHSRIPVRYIDGKVRAVKPWDNALQVNQRNPFPIRLSQQQVVGMARISVLHIIGERALRGMRLHLIRITRRAAGTGYGGLDAQDFVHVSRLENTDGCGCEMNMTASKAKALPDSAPGNGALIQVGQPRYRLRRGHPQIHVALRDAHTRPSYHASEAAERKRDKSSVAGFLLGPRAVPAGAAIKFCMRRTGGRILQVYNPCIK